MATEAQVSAAIVKGLRAAGHVAWKVSDKFTAGIPDIVGATNVLPTRTRPGVSLRFPFSSDEGRMFGIETKIVQTLPKRPASKLLAHPLSRAQYTFLLELEEVGAMAYVAIATPKEVGKGVDVRLVAFGSWDRAADLSNGLNISLEAWDVLKQNPRGVVEAPGTIANGFLPSGGPLGATLS